jgi:hypothetical protein
MFHSNYHEGGTITPANERYCGGGNGRRSFKLLAIESRTVT